MMSWDQELPLEQELNANNGLFSSLGNVDHETEFKLTSTIHKLMKGVWGTNFVSPIEQELKERKEFKVLDVGCGNTCNWLLELSKDYPLANFIGVDLSPSFPKDFSQNNLRFIHSNILEGLPFEDDSIDFVHARCLSISLTERQWEEVIIKELVRVCKPGGWIEIVEIDVDGKSMGPTSKRLLTAFKGNLEDKGFNGLISEEIPDFLESTNQVEIYTDEEYSPIGDWGDHVGKLALELFPTIFQISDNMINTLGVSEKEYEDMISKFMEEAESYHPYFISLRFHCQKYTSY